MFVAGLVLIVVVMALSTVAQHVVQNRMIREAKASSNQAMQLSVFAGYDQQLTIQAALATYGKLPSAKRTHATAVRKARASLRDIARHQEPSGRRIVSDLSDNVEMRIAAEQMAIDLERDGKRDEALATMNSVNYASLKAQAASLTTRLQEHMQGDLDQTLQAHTKLAQTVLLLTIITRIIILIILIAAITHLARWYRRTRIATHKLDMVRASKQLVLSSVNDAIFVTDQAGVIVYANPAAALLAESPDPRGKTLPEVLCHSSSDSPLPCVSGEASEDSRGEFKIHREDGSSLWVEVSCTPLLHEGTSRGRVYVLRDSTDRKLSELAKDEFTSIISHELRTPLTSIRAALGLLQAGALTNPAQQQASIDLAVKNSERLMSLINDMLDVNQIAANRLSLNRVACNLTEIMHHACSSLADFAVENQVDIQCTLPARRAMATAFVDERRVEQMLINLVHNSIKFTPPHGLVTVYCEGDSEVVRLHVCDTGPGIPRHLHQDIFNRYVQADTTTSRAHDGTGLGLAICAGLAKLHGGSIRLIDVPTGGAHFIIELPRYSAEQADAIARESAMRDDERSIA